MVTLNADTLILLEKDVPAVRIRLSAFLLSLIREGARSIRLRGPAREGRGNDVEAAERESASIAVDSRSEACFPVVRDGVESIFQADGPIPGMRSFLFVVGGKPLSVDVESKVNDGAESISFWIRDAESSTSDADQLAWRYLHFLQNKNNMCIASACYDNEGARAGEFIYLSAASIRKRRRSHFFAWGVGALMLTAWFGWWAALAASAFQRMGFGAVATGAGAVLGLVVAGAIPGVLYFLLHPAGRSASRIERISRWGVAARTASALAMFLVVTVLLSCLVEWSTGADSKFGTLGWAVRASVAVAGVFACFGLIAQFRRRLRGAGQKSEEQDSLGYEVRGLDS